MSTNDRETNVPGDDELADDTLESVNGGIIGDCTGGTPIKPIGPVKLPIGFPPLGPPPYVPIDTIQ